MKLKIPGIEAVYWSWNTLMLSSFSKDFSGPKWFFLACTTIKLKKNNQLFAWLWFSAEVWSRKSSSVHFPPLFLLEEDWVLQSPSLLSYSSAAKHISEVTCVLPSVITSHVVQLFFFLHWTILFYLMAFPCYFFLGLPTFAGYKNASKSCAPETYTSPVTLRLFPLKFDREMWTTL